MNYSRHRSFLNKLLWPKIIDLHRIISLFLSWCRRHLQMRLLWMWILNIISFKHVHGFYRNQFSQRSVAPHGLPSMVTSSNGNIFRVTGPLCRALIGHRWIPHAKASDAELWCYFMFAWTNVWANHRDAGDLRRHCTDLGQWIFCLRLWCICNGTK